MEDCLANNRGVSVYNSNGGRPFKNQNEELLFSKQYIKKISSSNQNWNKSPTYDSDQYIRRYMENKNKSYKTIKRSGQFNRNGQETQQESFKKKKGDGQLNKDFKTTNEKTWKPIKKIYPNHYVENINQLDQDQLNFRAAQCDNKRHTVQMSLGKRDPVVEGDPNDIADQFRYCHKGCRKNQSVDDHKEYLVFPNSRANQKHRVEGLKSNFHVDYDENRIIREYELQRKQHKLESTRQKNLSESMLLRHRGSQIKDVINYRDGPQYRNQPLTQKCNHLNIVERRLGFNQTNEFDFRRKNILQQQNIFN